MGCEAVDHTPQGWIDEATARCRALAADGFGARADAACAAAVTWRWANSETVIHRPEPFAAQRSGREAEWREEPSQFGSTDRVGLDARGRPVVVVSWFERQEGDVVEIWEHTGDRSVGLRRLDDTEGAEPRAWVTILDDSDRPSVVVSAEQGSMWVDDVPVVEIALERWTWEGDRVRRGELRPASAAHAWRGDGGAFIIGFGGDEEESLDGDPAIVEPTYDGDGTLVALAVDGRPLLGAAADSWFDDVAERVRAESADSMSSSVDSTDRPPGDAFDATQPLDHESLAAALLSRGVSAAAAIVRDHAAPALQLVTRDRPSGELPRTRLYGSRGVLPPGEPWPHSRGRALGFLAAIDLSELPREIVGVPNPLPAAGWLSFFADLDTHEGQGENWEQGTFLGEGYPNAEGEPSRVFWVPPGEEPAEVDPPPLRARSVALMERRCTVVAKLHLPVSWEALAGLDLPEPEERAYEEFARAQSPWGEDAVLGLASGMQGYGPRLDESVLLHLASAEFQDGGNVQFRLPTAALADGDWSQVQGFGESG